MNFLHLLRPIIHNQDILKDAFGILDLSQAVIKLLFYRWGNSMGFAVSISMENTRTRFHLWWDTIWGLGLRR